MGSVRVVLLLLLVVPGCWADFPESRFSLDGASPDWGTYPDGRRLDLPRGEGGLVDVRPPAESTAPCTPGVFIRCASNSQLEKCNSTGDGTLLVSCGTSLCQTDLGRCTQCTPGAAAHCGGSDLVTCNSDGLEVKTTCPLGCSADACCVDGDKDGKSGCDGDCDDANSDIFPGQQTYFTTAAGGSYDYDCNSAEDLQYQSTVDCAMVGPSCKGEGWLAAPIPACGASGAFVTCAKQGSQCKPEESTVTQGCR